ncbi:MAG TPA: 50S ribosomal protein L3 [Candidatus Babeliales bacterium]|nr:50S ribosomal protein L3 [Candidatus Babeliales bacterium]
MITGIWGRKIGMTQVFANDKVVPATAISIADWYITNIKTVERDGYNALQVGSVKDRFKDEKYSKEWIKNPNHYFSFIREIPLKQVTNDFAVGKRIDFSQLIKLGEIVDVRSKTIGKSFAGVVKRHRFGGPPGSHGSTMGNRPGSIGSLVKSGHVIKGKRLPGHMGCDNQMMRNLEIVMVEAATKTLLVKGSIPGKAGSLVFVRKA